MQTNHKPSRMDSRESQAAALIGCMGKFNFNQAGNSATPHKSGRALRRLMKRICARFEFIGVLGALVALPGCAMQPDHGIPNLAVVDAEKNIYRGGEPVSVEDWAQLHAAGVSNVVELNFARDAQPGFQFNRFPISFGRQIFGPSRETVGQAVCAITPGTFIHCTHGQDRTGLIVAEYRVWACGWSRDQARAEMLEHGFHQSLFGLEWFWSAGRTCLSK